MRKKRTVCLQRSLKKPENNRKRQGSPGGRLQERGDNINLNSMAKNQRRMDRQKKEGRKKKGKLNNHREEKYEI